MFSSLVNSIPILGHAKGIIHYVAGDTEAGNTAMYEATRSTAVIGGGAVGLLAGPAGAVAGAMAGGALTDTSVSILTSKPQGIVAGVADIGNDIADGNYIPVKSVLKTGAMVGLDALSGVGAGVITKNVAQSVAKSTGKSIGKKIAKDILVRETETIVLGMVAQSQISSKLREDNASASSNNSNNSEESNNSKKANPSDTSYNSTPAKNSQDEKSSSNGSQPPDGNKNNKNNKKNAKELEIHWAAFLKIFGVELVDDICIRGRYPFKGLTKKQIDYLKNLIYKIRDVRGDYYFRQVIELVTMIFDKLDAEDVTHLNFISMVNFVDAYIGEKLAENNESSWGSTNDSFKIRQERGIAGIFADMTKLATEILHTFKDLCKKMSEYRYRCDPYFRDIFAAVYHYFKHRVLPETGDVLSIAEYFNLITFLLQKVKNLKIYGELGSTNRRVIRYWRYFDEYKRRVLIVVKVQNGQIVLSSCYVLDDCVDENDKDGDVYVDDENKKYEEDKNDEK